MSIGFIQEKFFKPGCLFGVSVLSLLALGSTMMSQCSRSTAMGDRVAQREQGGVAALTIGDFKLGDVVINRILSQNVGVDPNNDPAQDAFTVARNYIQISDPGYRLALAKEKGIIIDDKTLLKDAQESLDQQIQTARFQLMMSGKLGEKATDADFEKEFQKMVGKSVADFKAEELAKVQERIKKPSDRILLAADSVGTILVTNYTAKVNPTDAEVKTGLDTIVVKRIEIAAQEGKERAEALLAKAKAEGFEKVMDESGRSTPGSGKKPSEETTTYAITQVRGNAAFQPLLKLKPGELSGVIDLGDSFIIAKFVEQRSTPRSDYDKNKDRYKEEYKRSVAQYMVDADIRALKSKVKPVFVSKNLEIISKYASLISRGQPSIEALKSLTAEIKASTGDDFRRELNIIQYASLSQLSEKNPTDAKLKDELVEAGVSLLDSTENFFLRSKLLDAFIAKNEGELASKMLVGMAEANTLPDAIGQSHYNTINAKLELLKNKKLINEEAIARITKAQSDWKEEFRQKQEADAQAAAERKKAMEEEAKAKSKIKLHEPTAPNPETKK